MPSILNTLIKNVFHIIYYQRCASCGEVGDIICKACENTFAIIDDNEVCPVCGKNVGRRIICGACITEKRYFSEGYFGYVYENKLRDAIHTFKFNGKSEVGRYLVAHIKKKILPLSEKIDLIIPMPITDRRLKERGFNQSYVISHEISKILNKPVYDSVLVKTKETKDQYLLSKEERKKNIKGAFALINREKIKDKRVLLVDDLYTTGYTANEAAFTLSKAKPESIILFALARTP